MAIDDKVARNSALMAFGTLFSRFTGIARDIAMTAALGLGIVSDAYSLGNTVPNTLYTLLIGGALQAIFVPQLVRHAKDDPDGGDAFAHRLITMCLVALLVITVVCVAAAPWIIDIYATSSYTADQLDMAVMFAWFCLPQIFFYGVYTMFAQVLNSRERFGSPMFAPIVNNVIAIFIFGAFIFTWGTQATADNHLDSGQIAWLGVGTTLGVAAQALMLVPFARRAGYKYSPAFDWKGFGLGKSVDLAKWTIGVVALNQVAFLVTSRLATQANVIALETGAPAGGLTTYQKAYLIFVLPHSLITVSLVTALMPGMSKLAHAGQFKEMGATVAGSMRTIAALVIPIGAVMLAAGPLIAEVLFGYGAVQDTAESDLLGHTVMAFTVGLLPFTLYWVLIRGWYALEDTRTVCLQGFLLNAVNVLVSFLLFQLYPTVIVLALGTASAYWVTFLFAWRQLHRRLGNLETRVTALALLRMLLAGTATFLVVWVIDHQVDPGGKLEQYALLAGVSLLGLAVYLVAAKLLRVAEVGDMVGMVRRKVGR